jgi:DNA-binding PadR family transcriptional regulator
LEDIEDNNLIEKRELTLGKRAVTIYRTTQKGMAFCRDILEPYEKMFPRRKEEVAIKGQNSTEEDNEKKTKNLNKGSLMLVLI